MGFNDQFAVLVRFEPRSLILAALAFSATMLARFTDDFLRPAAVPVIAIPLAFRRAAPWKRQTVQPFRSGILEKNFQESRMRISID